MSRSTCQQQILGPNLFPSMLNVTMPFLAIDLHTCPYITEHMLPVIRRAAALRQARMEAGVLQYYLTLQGRKKKCLPALRSSHNMRLLRVTNGACGCPTGVFGYQDSRAGLCPLPDLTCCRHCMRPGVLLWKRLQQMQPPIMQHLLP